MYFSPTDIRIGSSSTVVVTTDGFEYPLDPVVPSYPTDPVVLWDLGFHSEVHIITE